MTDTKMPFAPKVGVDTLDQWDMLDGKADGRVLVRKFPAPETTEGGIIKTETGRRRPDCIAMVIRSSVPGIQDGHAVVFEELALSNVLAVIGEDVFHINAKDVIFVSKEPVA